MQIQKYVWQFHWKHDKSQSRTNGQNPHPEQQHTWFISHQTTNTFKTRKHKDPNHLWDMFKAEVNRLSTLHIPTRKIKSKANIPWVTHEIDKLIKKTCAHNWKGHVHKKVTTLKSSNISSQPYNNRLEMHTGYTKNQLSFLIHVHKVLVTRKSFTTLSNTRVRKHRNCTPELWRSHSLRSSVEGQHTQQTIWISLSQAFATQPQTISKKFNV